MSASAVAFVSGPSMVAEFTGVRVGLETLGGVGVHAAASGLCTLQAEDPRAGVAELLGFLPSHTDEEGPFVPTVDPVDRAVPELRSVVPARGSASYDVRDVARTVVDDEVLCELWARWAPQMVTALGRVAG